MYDTPGTKEVVNKFLGIRSDKVKTAAYPKTNIFCSMTLIKLYMAYTVANIVLYKSLRTFRNRQKGQCTRKS